MAAVRNRDAVGLSRFHSLASLRCGVGNIRLGRSRMGATTHSDNGIECVVFVVAVGTAKVCLGRVAFAMLFGVFALADVVDGREDR